MPNIAAKIFWAKTKRGWHGYFYSNKHFPHGKIICGGQRIGEMSSAEHFVIAVVVAGALTADRVVETVAGERGVIMHDYLEAVTAWLQAA